MLLLVCGSCSRRVLVTMNPRVQALVQGVVVPACFALPFALYVGMMGTGDGHGVHMWVCDDFVPCLSCPYHRLDAPLSGVSAVDFVQRAELVVAPLLFAVGIMSEMPLRGMSGSKVCVHCLPCTVPPREGPASRFEHLRLAPDGCRPCAWLWPPCLGQPSPQCCFGA